MFSNLDGEQVRIQINAIQTYEAWRDADQEFRHSYKGRMNWSNVKGTQYLYRIIDKSRKSLGPRSPETEKIQADYTAQRTRLRQRRNRLWEKVKRQAPINRANRLGRIPKIAAEILRKLDQQQLLGEHLIVVGTHSIYAYEAAASMHVSGDLLTTSDIDLLWDVRRKLRLALFDVDENGVLGILKNIDSSFHKSKKSYRAINDDGYFVDLIRPMEKDEVRIPNLYIGDDSDLEAAAISGLQWLMNAPRLNQIAIGDDGYPVMISCTDPRVFSLYKRWLSEEAENREPGKRRRDKQQAIAVAKIAHDYLGLKFTAKDLSALPLRLTQHAKKLVAEVIK